MTHHHPLHPHAAGVACAAISGLSYALCAVAFAASPSAAMAFFSLFFHGVDLQKIAMPGFVFGAALLGLALTLVATYVFTWLGVILYNALITHRSASTGEEGSTCCRQ